MIGREVRTIRWHGGQEGVVVRWEPLGAAMCDALVRFEDGSEVWFSSRDLRPRGALEGVPLPDRAEAQRTAKARTLAGLKLLRAEMVRQVREHVPWPGMEFGKGHLGQAIDLAIGDLEEGS